MRFKRGEFVISSLRRDIVRYRVLTLSLLAIIALLTITLSQQRQKTIILPPERAQYILEEFSPSYIEGFALMWAKNLLDYTPANCFERGSKLVKHLYSSSSIEKIARENDFIRREQITQTFYPSKIDISQEKVIFKGSLKRELPGQKPLIKEAKITIKIAQGPLSQPLIVDWQIGELT